MSNGILSIMRSVGSKGLCGTQYFADLKDIKTAMEKCPDPENIPDILAKLGRWKHCTNEEIRNQILFAHNVPKTPSEEFLAKLFNEHPRFAAVLVGYLVLVRGVQDDMFLQQACIAGDIRVVRFLYKKCEISTFKIFEAIEIARKHAHNKIVVYLSGKVGLSNATASIISPGAIAIGCNFEGASASVMSIKFQNSD